VIVHGNAERLRHGDDLLGHRHVGAGRHRVARGVAVRGAPERALCIEKPRRKLRSDRRATAPIASAIVVQDAPKGWRAVYFLCSFTAKPRTSS
jgi:hypothetical protein